MKVNVGINNKDVLMQMIGLMPRRVSEDLIDGIALSMTYKEIESARIYWKRAGCSARSNKHTGSCKTTTAHRYSAKEKLYGITKRVNTILNKARESLKLYQTGMYDVPTMEELQLSRNEYKIIDVFKEHAIEQQKSWGQVGKKVIRRK